MGFPHEFSNGKMPLLESGISYTSHFAVNLSSKQTTAQKATCFHTGFGKNPVFSFCEVNTWSACLTGFSEDEHESILPTALQTDDIMTPYMFLPLLVSCAFLAPLSSPWLSSVQTSEHTMCLTPRWIQGEVHTQVKKRWQRRKIDTVRANWLPGNRRARPDEKWPGSD